MSTIEVPDQILGLLQGSRLSSLSASDQVRAALAIHLFQEGLISAGKAAELASIPRIEFESILGTMRIPVVRYDLADYERDLEAIDWLERRTTS